MKITNEDVALYEVYLESEKDEPNMMDASARIREKLKNKDIDFSELYSSLKSKGYITGTMIGGKNMNFGNLEGDVIDITAKGEKRIEDIMNIINR